MNKHEYKLKITETVIKELPYTVTFEEALRSMWFTGTNSDVLRLTDVGDSCFRTAQLEYFQFDFKPKPIDTYHKFMLDLGKKMRCPYYINVNKIEGEKSQPYIRVYDSKIAMLLSLHGNLDSYLKSVRISR